jgi:hypothetical protein
MKFSVEVVEGHHMKALCVRARIIIWSVGQCEERKSSKECNSEVYNYALFPFMRHQQYCFFFNLSKYLQISVSDDNIFRIRHIYLLKTSHILTQSVFKTYLNGTEVTERIFKLYFECLN